MQPDEAKTKVNPAGSVSVATVPWAGSEPLFSSSSVKPTQPDRRRTSARPQGVDRPQDDAEPRSVFRDPTATPTADCVQVSIGAK
jgi:hypothetical protein